MKKPSSKAIAVLGMHRSGTSVTTRVVQLLGAYLGEESDLMPTLPDNPEAHVRRVPVAVETVPLSFERIDHPDPAVLQFQYGKSYWDRQVSEPSDFSVVRDGDIAVTAVPLFGSFD